jgi:hypothetical protein
MSIEAAAANMHKVLEDSRGHEYTRDLEMVVREIIKATATGVSTFTILRKMELNPYVLSDLQKEFHVESSRAHFYEMHRFVYGWKYTAVLRQR